VIYFDTNVLVYFSIDQDEKKLQISREKIFEAIKNREFFISPLVIIEYIFILSKLNILDEQYEKVEFFLNFVNIEIDKKVINEAFLICKRLKRCKNINDTIHFVIATKYCKKILTFDKDFKKFKNENLKIEILKG